MSLLNPLCLLFSFRSQLPLPVSTFSTTQKSLQCGCLLLTLNRHQLVWPTLFIVSKLSIFPGLSLLPSCFFYIILITFYFIHTVKCTTCFMHILPLATSTKHNFVKAMTFVHFIHCYAFSTYKRCGLLIVFSIYWVGQKVSSVFSVRWL